MKKISNIIISICLSILLLSCTEKMDIKLDNTYTRLVVDASISTDTTKHKVILTKSSSFYDSNIPLPVTGATVTITDGSNTFSLNENAQLPGVYETASNVYGVIGKTYNLTIKNVDIDNDGVIETYNATTKINPVNKIDSIQVVYNPDWKLYEVKCFAWDPPTTDFYKFEIYKNGVLQSDTLTENSYNGFTDDQLFNGNYTNGVTVGFLRDSKSGEKGYPGDLITFELKSITKEYFQFLFEVIDNTSPSIPLFSGPPANVKGNISNGAIGFFYGYSKSRASCVIK